MARAVAGGSVCAGDDWQQRRVEWLAHYRLQDGRITEINVLEVVHRPGERA